MNSAILKIVALLVLNSEVSVHDQRVIVIENVRAVMQHTKYIKEASITFQKTTNKSLKRKLKRHRCACGIGFCPMILKKSTLTLVVDKPITFEGDTFHAALWNYSCKRPEIDVFLNRISSDLLREEMGLFLNRCWK